MKEEIWMCERYDWFVTNVHYGILWMSLKEHHRGLGGCPLYLGFHNTHSRMENHPAWPECWSIINFFSGKDPAKIMKEGNGDFFTTQNHCLARFRVCRLSTSLIHCPKLWVIKPTYNQRAITQGQQQTVQLNILHHVKGYIWNQFSHTEN